MFNIFKNTVFSIIIGIVLIMISCGNKLKEDIKDLSFVATQTSLIPKNTKPVVGANQTNKYIPLLQGKRVAIVANQTSVIFNKNSKGYTHLVDSLITLGVDIKKVFAPEHGFRGSVDAGEHVKDGIDTKTNLPLISLYGKNKKPTANQLKNLDIVIFDIQDVGVRFYTYISTLHYIMEACAEQNIPVLILDRPNPNGHYIDGPTLEIKHKSFLGMHPIPLVHGMTIAEYATMINGEKWLKNGIKSSITIIPVKNYTHKTTYNLTIRPSPNLPNDQSIKLYPSLGLFEGTNINAGRGTEYQFQRFGAPFLNQNIFDFTYTPKANFGAKYPKHLNKTCYGKDLKNVVLKPSINLHWLIEAYNSTTDKTLFFNTANFTKHAGTNKLQKQIEAGLNEKDIKSSWVTDLALFKKTRKKYLIYP